MVALWLAACGGTTTQKPKSTGLSGIGSGDADALVAANDASATTSDLDSTDDGDGGSFGADVAVDVGTQDGLLPQDVPPP
jgi:hypothetical protein